MVGESPSPAQANPFDTPLNDDSPAKSAYATPSPYQLEDSTLKNLEILIGNMEQNQAKQNQEVLRSIETMLETFKGKPELEYETDPEVMRILTKSPISTLKPSGQDDDRSTEDVKNFVWQHIQDIVPNLVQQVEQELMERTEPASEETQPSLPEPEPEPEPETTPSVDPAVYIMEEVIKPNLREASIREELPTSFIYATEIANFKLEFDRGTERWHEAESEFDDLEDAERIVYKSYMAPKEAAQEEKTLSSEKTLPPTETPQEAAPEPTLSSQKTEPAKVEMALRESPTASEAVNEASANPTEEADREPSKEIKNNIQSMVPDSQAELDDKPSTSRDANRRNKRSQQSKKTRSRESSQKPINRIRLPKDADPKQNETKEVQKDSISKDVVIEIKQAEAVVAKESSTEESKVQAVEVVTNGIDLISTQEAQTQQVEEVKAEPKVEINADEQNLDSNPLDIGETQNDTANEGTQSELETAEVLTSTPIEDTQKSPESVAIKVVNEREVPTPSNTLAAESTSESVPSSEVQVEDLPASIIPSDVLDSTTTAPHEVTVPSTSIISTEHKRSPKRFSKIPVRTLSSSSLRSESRASNRTPTATDEPEKEEAATEEERTEDLPLDNQSTDTKEASPVDDKTLPKEEPSQTIREEVKEPEVQPISGEKVEVIIPATTAIAVSPTDSDEVFEDATEFSGSEGTRPLDEATSDGELYSLDSDEPRVETKSPENEVILVLDEESVLESSIAKSSSQASIGSQSSQSETSKVVLKEFVPSGDPAKQNLSELVEDTQRLIKQMRDEISMDEFESTDEDEYSDEYSDEYDEGEEEDWYDSEGDEEGDYEGNTYNEHPSYIEEASTGDEGTEIEDIMEEDEDQADEEELQLTQPALVLETRISPALSVTPTNPEAEDPAPETEVVSSAGRSLVIELPEPSLQAEVPVPSTQEEALPIEPPPIIADSESRPPEPPSEVVLEVPAEVELPLKLSWNPSPCPLHPHHPLSTPNPDPWSHLWRQCWKNPKGNHVRESQDHIKHTQDSQVHSQ